MAQRTAQYEHTIEQEVKEAYADIYKKLEGEYGATDKERIKFLNDVILSMDGIVDASSKKINGKEKKQKSKKERDYWNSVSNFIAAHEHPSDILHNPDDELTQAEEYLEKLSKSYDGEVYKMFDVIQNIFEKRHKRQEYTELKNKYVARLKAGDRKGASKILQALKIKNRVEEYESSENLGDFVIDAGHNYWKPKTKDDFNRWVADYERAVKADKDYSNRWYERIVKVNKKKKIMEPEELEKIVSNPHCQAASSSSASR